MRPPEERILAFPQPIVQARHARSTIVLGSIAIVRASDRWADYLAHLAPEPKEILLSSVVGVWLPISVALAHYQACDAVGFSAEQAASNGRATFDRTSGTLLGTMLRMAKEVGVSPWTIVPHFQRFWERGYDGGGISVTRTGPKEARIELVQFPLCESRYYRNALRGLAASVLQLFCLKAYVTERAPAARAAGAMSLRAQWA